MDTGEGFRGRGHTEVPEDATGVRAWYRKGNGVAVRGSEEKEREIGCIGASSDSIATDSTTLTVTAGA